MIIHASMIQTPFSQVGRIVFLLGTPGLWLRIEKALKES